MKNLCAWHYVGWLSLSAVAACKYVYDGPPSAADAGVVEVVSPRSRPNRESDNGIGGGGVDGRGVGGEGVGSGGVGGLLATDGSGETAGASGSAGSSGSGGSGSEETAGTGGSAGGSGSGGTVDGGSDNPSATVNDRVTCNCVNEVAFVCLETDCSLANDTCTTVCADRGGSAGALNCVVNHPYCEDPNVGCQFGGHYSARRSHDVTCVIDPDYVADYCGMRCSNDALDGFCCATLVADLTAAREASYLAVLSQSVDDFVVESDSASLALFALGTSGAAWTMDNCRWVSNESPYTVRTEEDTTCTLNGGVEVLEDIDGY